MNALLIGFINQANGPSEPIDTGMRLAEVDTPTVAMRPMLQASWKSTTAFRASAGGWPFTNTVGNGCPTGIACACRPVVARTREGRHPARPPGQAAEPRRCGVLFPVRIHSVMRHGHSMNIHFLNCFTSNARLPSHWRSGTLCLLIETGQGLVLVDTGRASSAPFSSSRSFHSIRKRPRRGERLLPYPPSSA
jgi:hypothetical protein